MRYCSSCGTQIEDTTLFCPNCGVDTNVATATVVQNGVQDDAPSGILNVASLVWSIINLVLCCQLFGIISLIMTILAKSAGTATEEQSKLKTAKTLNLVGTILGVIIIVVYVVLVVAGVMAGTIGAIGA